MNRNMAQNNKRTPTKTRTRPSIPAGGSTQRPAPFRSQIPIRAPLNHGHGNHAHVTASQAEKLQAIRAIETRMRNFFASQNPPTTTPVAAHRLALSLAESQPLVQNIDNAFNVYGDRLQADMRDFRSLCGVLVKQEQFEKEQWRMLCAKTMKERDAARAVLHATRSGASTVSTSKSPTSSSAPFALKREREETPITSLSSQSQPSSPATGTQARPIRSLPLRSRSLPTCSFDFEGFQWVSSGAPPPSHSSTSTSSSSSDTRVPCTPPRRISSTPPQTTTAAHHLPSPPPLKPRLNINIKIEDERELKRRRSCDSASSSSSTTTLVYSSSGGIVHSPSPASDSGSEADSSSTARRVHGGAVPTGPQIQRAAYAGKQSTVISLPDEFMHVDIMYLPVNNTLVCRACQLEIAKAPPATQSRVLPKTFPTTAPWDDLREHCIRVHPEACVDVGRLHPAEIFELRRRLSM